MARVPIVILPVSISVIDEPSPESDDAVIIEADMLLDPNISPYIPDDAILLDPTISPYSIPLTLAAVMLLDPNISPYIPVVPISLSANIS